MKCITEHNDSTIEEILDNHELDDMTSVIGLEINDLDPLHS